MLHLKGAAYAAIDVRTSGLKTDQGDHALQIGVIPLSDGLMPVPNDLPILNLYIKPRVNVSGGAAAANSMAMPFVNQGITKELAAARFSKWWSDMNLAKPLIPIVASESFTFEFLANEVGVAEAKTAFNWWGCRSVTGLGSFFLDRSGAAQQPYPFNFNSLSQMARWLGVENRMGCSIQIAITIAELYRHLVFQTNGRDDFTKIAMDIVKTQSELTAFSVQLQGLADPEGIRREGDLRNVLELLDTESV